MFSNKIVHQFIKNFETKQAAADYLEISRHALARILRAEDAGRERKLPDKVIFLMHVYKPTEKSQAKAVKAIPNEVSDDKQVPVPPVEPIEPVEPQAPKTPEPVAEAPSGKDEPLAVDAQESELDDLDLELATGRLEPEHAPQMPESPRSKSGLIESDNVTSIHHSVIPPSFLQIFKEKDYMGTDILFRIARYPGVVFMVSIHGKRRALRARFFGSMDSVLLGSLPELPETRTMTPMEIVTDAIQKTNIYMSVERELNKLPLLDGSQAPRGPDRIYKTLLQIDELRGYVTRAHIANCISLDGFDWMNGIISKLKGRLA